MITPPRTTPVVISLCAYAAIGALMAPATAAIASILFRILNSFADDARRVSSARNASLIHRARHRSQENAHLSAAIFGILDVRWNPLKRQASAIVEPLQRIKSAPRFDIFPQP